MKKKVLFLAALMSGMSAFAFTGPSSIVTKAPFGPDKDVMAKAPAFAEDGTPYLDFTYADEVYSAYRPNNVSSGYIYLAFEFTKEDQAAFIGSKIVGMTITAGTSQNNTNAITRATAFVTDNLTSVPAQTTPVTLTTEAFGENYVALAEPVEIDGTKSLYPGYNFRYVANSFYLPTDANLLPVSQKTCLLGVSSSLKGNPDWMNVADQCGSLCLSIRIEGDNLHGNMVSLKNLSVEPRYKQNSDGSYTVTLKNTGLNSISSLNFKTDLSNGASTEYICNLSTPIKSGAKAEVKVGNVKTPAEAGFYTLSATVTKVNNEAVTVSTLDGPMKCYDNGFERKIVLEEATGNWCSNCPLGIIALDYVEKNYPDWITIAVHGPASYNEPMTVPGYQGLINDYGLAFPQVLVNREDSFGFSIASPKQPGTYEPYKEYYSSFPAYADIDITAHVPEDCSTVEIESKTKFALAGVNRPHNLEFVIVENNVGPYVQSNNLTGYNGYDLDGWNSKGGSVSTMYNHVARATNGYPGNGSAIPSTFEANVEYPYSLSMPLSYSYGKKPDNKSGTVINLPFRVVALVTDANTGVIVNAKAIDITESGVKSVSADKMNINAYVNGNDIIVTGTDKYSVYTLDGRVVSGKGVASGIYVVNADGKTFKVMVK